MQRYIITWRKTPNMGNVLDWDFYVADGLDEAEKVVDNIKKQGVVQYYTSPIGNKLRQLSCDF